MNRTLNVTWKIVWDVDKAFINLKNKSTFLNTKGNEARETILIRLAHAKNKYKCSVSKDLNVVEEMGLLR